MCAMCSQKGEKNHCDDGTSLHNAQYRASGAELQTLLFHQKMKDCSDVSRVNRASPIYESFGPNNDERGETSMV